ncbi:magnesium transporter, partial [Candidatus Saccharibacteria bacterium]|nr:magnesium transporter [Candidatus Saccharibacteria bacterium]
MNSLNSQIKKLLSEKNKEGLNDIFKFLHITAIIDIFRQSTDIERLKLIEHLPSKSVSKLFNNLDTSTKNNWLNSLSDQNKQKILKALQPSERINLIHDLPKHTVKNLVDLLEPEDLAETKKILGYPKYSVGRLMTSDFVAVNKDWTIKRVCEHIKERTKKDQLIHVVYVVDEAWKLLGQIELQKIILADEDSRISNIIDNNVAPLNIADDQKKAISYMNIHRLPAMPVVEYDNRLVGIVTFDDVADVASSKITEGIHKGAAIVPLNVGYRYTGTIQLFAKRAGWLVTLVFISLASSGVLA